MADPTQEYLSLLKQNVEMWNQWRQDHPDIRPYLVGANLQGADLRGANLSNLSLMSANCSMANLSYADLSQSGLKGVHFLAANLSYANLSQTNLWNTIFGNINVGYANLQGANLSGAELGGVNLSHANLTEANLSGAYLGGVDLSNAMLTGTNFTGASMAGTALGDRDLRVLRGLEMVQHRSPSPLTIRTIYLSEGDIPQAFLRGVGVPDTFLDYVRSLAGHPIQYHSCFISYAHDNDDLASHLYSDLQNHSVRCWFAPHDMHIGDKIRPRIDEAIHLQDKLLIILSEHSVNSDWVEHEVETALARERWDKRTILFPIRLDNAILERQHIGWAALVQNEHHIGDFTGWKDHDRYQAAFDRLLRDLKKADELSTTTQDTIV